jgi:D-alanyl-D-alanine carboxypeptidase
LPGLLPAARRITIRQLLGHRSGLANFTAYDDFLEAAERSATVTPRDMLRFAASKPQEFAAGASWSYSNTNYIALGLVIENVTGHTYAEELSRRILEPLDLEHTELPSARRLPELDDSGTNPQVPWAAGAIVSDAEDVARFYSALLSGELLSPEGLAAMKGRVTTLGPPAGLGLFADVLDCGTYWGHGGEILDYRTRVAASADGERVAVFSFRIPTPLDGPSLASLLCPSPAA